MRHPPIIGVTMGDPAGIGPEIIAMALTDRTVYDNCRPVVLGDPVILSDTMADTPFRAARKLSLNLISAPTQAQGRPGTIDLMALSDLERGSVRPGRPTVTGGRAMVAYILGAVEMCLQGEMEAMATCPIHKALMHQAGHHFEGHTQLLAHLTQTTDYVMMLAGQRLRVALVTIHCGLRDVARILNKAMVHQTILLTHKALREDFGLKAPRIAVAALNPHGGEAGLFGSEEETIIAPAIQLAKEKGIDAAGPYPADTLFYRAASGHYDVVIAMYHDQGLIPLKLLHFSDAVNVTLGLPIIRTSVDHGTAYEIAGQGTADPSSLKAAIKMAAELAENRCRFKSHTLPDIPDETA
ncbi:MAG: 4-hydroxythreonine-4-phosphate dehydrogenase PdxA [Thermodesulfobacteriota bacterium]